ncbi:MAG TPA: hypothetical protein VFQ22_13365, partial [Longimicrobiales bacterium]|nr:hypothetical protein [Longimicrobiales bacterium]
LKLFLEGFRTADQVSEEVPEEISAEEDIFTGAGIGLQPSNIDPGLFRAPPSGSRDIDPAFRRQPPAEARNIDPGFRREPPSIFRGARPGLARGTPPPMDQALGELARGGAAVVQEPEVLALPGAFVPGLGFAPRIITSDDMAMAMPERTRERAHVPRTRMRERIRPGVEQVDEDLFFDPMATPEGRGRAFETAREREQREQLERALAELELGDLSPEAAAELIEAGVPASHFLDRDDAPPARTMLVPVGNDRNALIDAATGRTIREFPAPSRSAADRPRGIPASLALDFLDRLYGVYEPDGLGGEVLVGYSIPDEELYEKLLGMVGGEEIDFGSLDPLELTPPQQELVQRMLAQARFVGAGGASGAVATPPTDAEVLRAIESMAGVPRDELEQALLLEGATPDQVQRLLGPRQ